MAYTMQDISGYAGHMWDQLFIDAWDKAQALYRLFRWQNAPAGVRTIDIPIFGSLTANQFTPGAGNPVTLQAGSYSKATITLDQCWEVSLLQDDFEAIQSAVDTRTALVKQMTDALIKKADTSVLTLLNGYSGVPTGHAQTSTTVDLSADPDGDITELERLLSITSQRFDEKTIPMGGRFVLLDAYVYRRLVAMSGKQSPERTDYMFGYAAGKANPMQGSEVYLVPQTTRSYDAYSNVTTVKAYHCAPDAIAIGLQRAPQLEVSRQGMHKSFLFSADELYGLKEADVRSICPISLKYKGNIFGL